MTTLMNSMIKHMLAIGLVLAVSGCATMQSDWEKAQQEDSFVSYTEFLRKYPDSEYKSIADQRVEKFTWDYVSASDSIKRINLYIAKYPNSTHDKDAKGIVNVLLKEASSPSENWKTHKRSEDMSELLNFCFDNTLTREQVLNLMGKPNEGYNSDHWLYTANPDVDSDKTETLSCVIQFNSNDLVIGGELKSSSGARTSKGVVKGGLKQSWGWSPPAEDAYTKAFALLKEGRYEQSIQAFESFKASYPDSKYADNAQYWLGEANYVSRDYKKALSAFQQLVAQYPESSKNSGARLKIGYVYFELKNWSAARDALQQVITLYPDTTVAKKANERLQRIKREGH